MPSRNILAIALLLLLGPLSVAGKLAWPQPAHRVAAPALVQAADVLLRDGGLEHVASRSLIDGAAYRLAIYRHRQPEACPGLLYLMPMATNAEASALFTRATPSGMTDRFYVLDGQLSEEFPSVRQWLSRTTAQLQRTLGGVASTPIVYGVATTEACLDARRFNWPVLRA